MGGASVGGGADVFVGGATAIVGCRDEGSAAREEIGEGGLEGFAVFAGERLGFGLGADGEVDDAVEVFVGGADAGAGELEAVKEEGEFVGGAKTMFDSGCFVGGDEGVDVFDGFGETLAGVGGVDVVDEGRANVALVGDVARGEFFSASVELVEFPFGGAAVEPGHACGGELGGALRHDDFEPLDEALPCTALAAVVQPEDAEGEDAVDGGGRFVFADADDGPCLIAAQESAARVGGAEGFLQVHGGAEGFGRVVGESAREGAFKKLDVALAGGVACGGGTRGAGGDEFEELGLRLAEAPRV